MEKCEYIVITKQKREWLYALVSQVDIVGLLAKYCFLWTLNSLLI